MFWLKAADVFFVVFHSSLVFVNLFGWIWPRMRRWSLILLILTGLSWTVLGIWYGLGYCPLTDWHWDVLHALGERNLPSSYMKYLLDRIFGTNLDPAMVDLGTLVFYLLALIITIFLNLRDWKRRKKKQAAGV